jgi:O-antigen ligase
VSKYWLIFLILFTSILVLSFSRSAIIGLIVILFYLLAIWLKRNTGLFTSLLIGFLLLVVVGLGGSALFKNQNKMVQNLISHGDSSSLRFEQYQRIWDSRHEIGLLGRGMGTAGPSSQFRLDGGKNHWTENIYLDLFEETGLIGLIIYLLFFISVLYFGAKAKIGLEKQSLILILVSFALTGIFINYYTGQVGIMLLWLAAGTAIGSGHERKDTSL